MKNAMSTSTRFNREYDPWFGNNAFNFSSLFSDIQHGKQGIFDTCEYKESADAAVITFNVAGIEPSEFEVTSHPNNVLQLKRTSKASVYQKRYSIRDAYDMSRATSEIRLGLLTVTIPAYEKKNESIPIPIKIG